MGYARQMQQSFNFDKVGVLRSGGTLTEGLSKNKLKKGLEIQNENDLTV